jgi:UrcA family protein
MKIGKLLLAISFLSGVSAALPALAVDAPAEPPRHTGNVAAMGKSQAVDFADLDTTHKAGATVLLARVKLAATQVCGPEPSVDLSRTYRNCVTDTMTRAVRDLDQPVVSSLYHDKFGITVVASKPATPASGVTAATNATVH